LLDLRRFGITIELVLAIGLPARRADRPGKNGLSGRFVPAARLRRTLTLDVPAKRPNKYTAVFEVSGAIID